MAHSKDDARFLDGSFHLHARLDRRGHGLLAQYVVALRSEREGNFHVQMVLDGDDHSIRQAFANGLERVRGCLEEVLVGFEHQSLVYGIRLCHNLTGLGARLGDGHHFAQCWFLQCVRSITLISRRWYRHSKRTIEDRTHPTALAAADDSEGDWLGSKPGEVVRHGVGVGRRSGEPQ